MTQLPGIEARIGAQERMSAMLYARIEELSQDMTASFQQEAKYHAATDRELDIRFRHIDARLDRLETTTATKEDIASFEGRLREDMISLEGHLKDDMISLGGHLREDMISLEGHLKDDMISLEGRLKGEIVSLEGRLKDDMTSLEGRLKEGFKEDMTSLEGRLKGDIASLGGRMATLEQRFTSLDGRFDQLLQLVATLVKKMNA